MPASLPLGNDVVDLGHGDNLRSAANQRYRERVLAGSEHRALCQRRHASRAFLAYWAAKEAAFKALSRGRPALVFAHRQFVVREDAAAPIGSAQRAARGEVEHSGIRIPVRWHWTDDWVHCFTATGNSTVEWEVRALAHCSVSPAASVACDDAALSDESRAVRSLAVALLCAQGIDDARVQSSTRNGRRGPPTVICSGHPREDVCLSLSHDGRFVAAAFATCDGASPI